MSQVTKYFLKKLCVYCLSKCSYNFLDCTIYDKKLCYIMKSNIISMSLEARYLKNTMCIILSKGHKDLKSP